MISKLEDFDYTMEQSEDGYKNFTVIKCHIKSIEWLYLAAKGHRCENTWLVKNNQKLIHQIKCVSILASLRHPIVIIIWASMQSCLFQILLNS